MPLTYAVEICHIFYSFLTVKQSSKLLERSESYFNYQLNTLKKYFTIHSCLLQFLTLNIYLKVIYQYNFLIFEKIVLNHMLSKFKFPTRMFFN